MKTIRLNRGLAVMLAFAVSLTALGQERKRSFGPHGDLSQLSSEERQHREAVAALITVWAESGGKEFRPSLNFPEGVPTLMVTAFIGEDTSKRARRRQALLSALAGVLQAGAYDSFRITQIVRDREAPRGSLPTVHNVLFERAEFFERIQSLTGAASPAQALDMIKDSPESLEAFFQASGL